MNRNTYFLGIFYQAISLVVGIVHSVILLKQGPSMVFLQSYAIFFLIGSLILLGGQLISLRYFYFQKFRFVFITGVIALLIGLINFIFQYIVLITVARDLALYYPFIVAAYCLVNFAFAGGLIFSAAAKKPWLHILGITMTLIGLLMLIGVFGSWIGIPQETAMQFLIWSSVLTTGVPVFFILTFIGELKSIQAEAAPSFGQESFHYVMGIAGASGLVLVFAFGQQLGTESYWALDWEKRGPEEGKRLALPFDARIHVDEKGDTLHYLLMKPLHYDSLRNYPIVTCLHGGPTRVPGRVIVTQPAALLSESYYREKYPAFLFVPQGRPGILWGGIPGVPSMESLVFDAMRALEEEFNIDEKRRYVAGISGGGYGTWHFISTHPDMFAAAIPMCGAGNPELASKVVNVPVWAFHGEVDRNVSVSGSRDMIGAIKNAGGDPKYNEFPGVGHHVWPEVEKTPGVLDWLFAQRRE